MDPTPRPANPMCYSASRIVATATSFPRRRRPTKRPPASPTDRTARFAQRGRTRIASGLAPLRWLEVVADHVDDDVSVVLTGEQADLAAAVDGKRRGRRDIS